MPNRSDRPTRRSASPERDKPSQSTGYDDHTGQSHGTTFGERRDYFLPSYIYGTSGANSSRNIDPPSTGDSLSLTSPKDKDKDRAELGPSQNTRDNGQRFTDQQDTHEDTTMRTFLSKKDKILSKITSPYLSILRRNIDKEDFNHLYTNLSIIKDSLMYNSYTYKEATAAYQEIKTCYSNGTYRHATKQRCKNLEFPFAQD